MCLDASTFFNSEWLDSITEEAPAQEPAPEPAPVSARARADVFVLSIETELYASVMYDKRKQIEQHALSQV